MLSVFPSLFSYSLLVPLVFRLVIGLTFITFGYGNVTKKRESKLNLLSGLKLRPAGFWLWCLSLMEMIGGLMLVVGIATQVIALIFSIFIILKIIGQSRGLEITSLSQSTLFLLALISASLLFLGPGFYSVDLPL